MNRSLFVALALSVVAIIVSGDAELRARRAAVSPSPHLGATTKSGAIVPSGTGFFHVTGGVEDPAAREIGWQTAASVSFAGLTDPGLASNGTYTLAGLSVKRENAANDRVAMSVGADGISLSPNISQYLPSGNVRTAPLLWFTIPVALDWTSGVRLSIRISSSSQSAFDNGHYVYIGIDSDSTAYASWCGQGTNTFLGRLFGSGVAVNGGGLFSNRAAGGAASTGAFVLTCEIPAILKAQSESMALYRDGVAAWPDMTTLAPVVGASSYRSPFDVVNPSNVAVSARLGIIIAADSPSAADAYTVTISDLRVDYSL